MPCITKNNYLIRSYMCEDGQRSSDRDIAYVWAIFKGCQGTCAELSPCLIRWAHRMYEAGIAVAFCECLNAITTVIQGSQIQNPKGTWQYICCHIVVTKTFYWAKVNTSKTQNTTVVIGCRNLNTHGSSPSAIYTCHGTFQSNS